MGIRAGQKTTRMSIDVSLKDHRRIKILAAAEGVSMREFVVECVFEKIYSENEKIPNKTTKKALESARKRKGTKAKDFEDICHQLGIPC